jgi:hypothetical protein
MNEALMDLISDSRSMNKTVSDIDRLLRMGNAKFGRNPDDDIHSFGGDNSVGVDGNGIVCHSSQRNHIPDREEDNSSDTCTDSDPGSGSDVHDHPRPTDVEVDNNSHVAPHRASSQDAAL